MFEELQFPELHIPAPDVMKYYIGTTANHTGRYLAGDGNLKGLPWLFDSLDEAILAAAAYYHNNGYAYPYQTEMIAAGKRFIEAENKSDEVESTIMRFE